MFHLLSADYLGDVAKWQGKGLQNPEHGFKSHRRLKNEPLSARFLLFFIFSFNMPSGKVHTTSTILLAAAAGSFMAYSGKPASQVVALSGGVLAGLILTPDLDMDQGSISMDLVRRSAGRFISALWYIFWQPYSRLIPHRSPLSHLPILGTALRLAYLAILPFLGWWFLGRAWPLPSIPAWLIWSVVGLALADLSHYILDQLF
jgi:uncharacterized metal-binding protein